MSRCRRRLRLHRNSSGDQELTSTVVALNITGLKRRASELAAELDTAIDGIGGWQLEDYKPKQAKLDDKDTELEAAIQEVDTAVGRAAGYRKEARIEVKAAKAILHRFDPQCCIFFFRLSFFKIRKIGLVKLVYLFRQGLKQP